MRKGFFGIKNVVVGIRGEIMEFWYREMGYGVLGRTYVKENRMEVVNNVVYLSCFK